MTGFRKKLGVLVLAAVIAVMFSPVMSGSVFAGDAEDFSGMISGKNADQTVDAGKTLTIRMSDLNAWSPGFKTAYNNGIAKVKWELSDSADFSGSSQDLAPEYKNEAFSLYVDPSYKNKYLRLYLTDSTGTNYNDTVAYKVNPRTANITEGPTIFKTTHTTTLLKQDVTVAVEGILIYNTSDEPEKEKRVEDIEVELYCNGKLFGKQTVHNDGRWEKNEVTFKNVPVPYGKSVACKVVLFATVEGMRVKGVEGSYTLNSAVLGQPTLYVTKIAANKAGLRWNSVSGATGFRIYAGSKLVKTLGVTNRYIVTRKKAGSAKYRVVPIVSDSGTIAEGPGSNTAKGKGNYRKYWNSSYYKSYRYGVATFAPRKVSLSGKTYTIKGYLVNNRVFKLKKMKRLDITLYCDGKKVAHKVFKNVKGCKAEGSRKITLKIKGKGGVDFAGTSGTTITWKVKPYWAGVGSKTF